MCLHTSTAYYLLKASKDKLKYIIFAVYTRYINTLQATEYDT